MTFDKVTITIMALTVFIASTVSAAPLDKIRFIKIAPQDEKAVIMSADGKLMIIKPGDVIGETVTVKEITTGRVVLEEKTDKGPETVIIRVENGKHRIERIRKQAEARPLPVSSLSSAAKPDSASKLQAQGTVLEKGQKQGVPSVKTPNNGANDGKTHTDKAQGSCSSCGANKK